MEDPIDIIIRLLEENWQPSKTDGTNPIVRDITTMKRFDLGNLKDRTIILIHVPTEDNPEDSGIGSQTKNESITLSIDLRSMQPRSTFWKIRAEIIRILENNITSPPGDYHILRPNIPGRIDLSNKSYGLYRYMIPVRLEKYAVAMTRP